MSSYGIELEDRIDVCLGFNPNIRGFWLFVQDHKQDTDEKDFYLFHNLHDVPGYCMSIPMLEETLERFQLGMAPDLLAALIKDALDGGYVERLRDDGKTAELQSFEKICHEVHDGSWKPRCKLPCQWW